MSSGFSQSQNYMWLTSDVLGQGATGVVYKGRDKRSGEEYAVKTFTADALRKIPRSVRMREFEVLKKLKHPNIVKLLALEEEKTERSETRMRIGRGDAGTVLVMELCSGGSVHDMLHKPQNAQGFSEEEFLCFLVDLTAGVKHLREENIVHRDIKPGNIMRYIAADGSSVYKLVDFGAARELSEGDAFVSMYGTEEYLHPDIYAKAVLGIPENKKFNASVDLWSIGATAFHVATGCVPFRPFEGRRDKYTMFDMIATKDFGVISGVQHSKGGQVMYCRELPPHCQLSRSLQELSVPVIAGCLEIDPNKQWKFEKLFHEVDKIAHKQVVHVFNVTDCVIHKCYVDKGDTMESFQGVVEKLTGLPSHSQMLLYQSGVLEEWIQKGPVLDAGLRRDYSIIFPEATQENPVILLNKKMSQQKYSLPRVSIPEYPHVSPESFVPDKDSIQALDYCCFTYRIEREVTNNVSTLELLDKTVKIIVQMELETARKVTTFLETFTGTREEIRRRLELLRQSHASNEAMLSKSQKMGSNITQEQIDSLKGLIETIETAWEHNESLWQTQCAVLKLMSERAQSRSAIMGNWKENAVSKMINDGKWEKKMNALLTSLNEISERMTAARRKHRPSPAELNTAELDKRQMLVLGKRAESIIESIRHNVVDTHRKFQKWYRSRVGPDEQMTGNLLSTDMDALSLHWNKGDAQIEELRLSQESVSAVVDQQQAKYLEELDKILQSASIKCPQRSIYTEKFATMSSLIVNSGSMRFTGGSLTGAASNSLLPQGANSSRQLVHALDKQLSELCDGTKEVKNMLVVQNKEIISRFESLSTSGQSPDEDGSPAAPDEHWDIVDHKEVGEARKEQQVIGANIVTNNNAPDLGSIHKKESKA